MLGTKWSKFQTLKNQFEQGSGRFVVPEPALRMGPRNQAKTKKKKHPKNVNDTKPNASFCRTEPFRTKKSKCFFNGVGLLAFLWPKTCNDNSEKTLQNKGFVVFVVVFSVARCCPNSNNIPTKQLTTTTTTTSNNI